MIRITQDEFIYLTSMIKENFGVNLIKKKTLIESRLANYLLNKGVSSYSEYFDIIKNDKTNTEMTQLINILTTNYSYFMREPDHFNYLSKTVLPYLKNEISDFDLRTWSAGCSTGQEPYTLAMLISDFFGKEAARWDYKILATDISQRALNTAINGRYTKDEIEAIPARWRLNYFIPQDEDYVVSDSIKKQVIFRKFNLMEEKFPFRKKFHIIFCRNVMIYFDKETKSKLVQKFYDCTENGGYLFVGQSEAINRYETPYEYVMPSVYRKR